MANEKRLIDANALLRRLQKRREDLASAWRTFDAMPINAQSQYHENLECSLIVEDHPIVDAMEVVHGRWKVSRESEISRNVWCTACGKDFYMHRKGELQIDKMPYCPYCGAKMDGDGNA